MTLSHSISGTFGFHNRKQKGIQRVNFEIAEVRFLHAMMPFLSPNNSAKVQQ